MSNAAPRHAPRYTADDAVAFAAAFRRDGFVLLKDHFERDVLAAWRAAFEPLLTRHIAAEGRPHNRGPARFYVTLPFREPFADPLIYEDPDILRICRLLVGDDTYMCQLASDTPLRGSEYQEIHRDALPLFPESGAETPPYQLAVNFPLVDVTAANGPTEIAAGTHEQTKEAGLQRLARGEVTLAPIEMRVGDVLVRDVRGLHRGTPNTTDEPRPMVVIGYSRRWLFRPEVAVRIGQSRWDALTPDQRYLLRFNRSFPTLMPQSKRSFIARSRSKVLRTRRDKPRPILWCRLPNTARVNCDAGLNIDAMYEVFYATTRIARITAADREMAKRRFAAYVLYDECDHVVSDVQLSFGDDAEITPFDGDAPVAGTRADVRAWVARRDAESEAFEVNCFEDPERTLDAYLRLLATNDPWRLEGHSSLGRKLSAVPMFGELVTFDGRVTYRFDATQFLDYIRFDVLAALDPLRPQESIRVDSLVDVAALRDDTLRQIASSYTTILAELRLTARFTTGRPIDRAFDVTFAADNWKHYIAHRIAEPARFLPPPGWTSAFPAYGGDP